MKDINDSINPTEEELIHGSPSYLAYLNKAQQDAVKTLEGPLLVLAGAGTGKTRVLTTRIAHIIQSKEAFPNNILAVTFTNKASKEMRERVQKLLNYSVEGMWLGTFHSICVRILRRHAEMVSLKTNFTILDADDQLRLIKQIIKSENIDEKKWPPRLVLTLINRWKDQALTPDKITSESIQSSKGDDHVLKIYGLYQERLKILNAVDFGDLLMMCIALFTKSPDTLRHYQTLFKYILVDEYQDTNIAQYLWLRLLAQGTLNICCVGDEDQSIYGWRGAEITNILKFEKDFPGAKVIRLEQNYRSTSHILGAASGLIANNKARLGKTLWTNGNHGEKVKILGVWDGAQEVRAVAQEIETLQQKEEKLSSMVVLVRAGFQTREFEERFLNLGIPYRVVGGHRFYERLEIRDALAYLRVIAQPADSLAFERIINTPRRGIGPSTVQSLHVAARNSQISLLQGAWDLVQTDEIRGKAKKSLKNLLESLERWRSQLNSMALPNFVESVLDESGYTDMWLQDKSADAPGRLENLKELVTALKDYKSLQNFLEHVSLVSENAQNADEDVMTIMTLHSAKGLEFDTVFLAGWEEDLFPHSRSLKEDGGKGLEEERRLAYVGLTRARKKVVISHAVSRQIHGGWQTRAPSRFIEELPKDHVSLESNLSSSRRHQRASPYSMNSFPRKTYGFQETPLTSEFYEIGTRVFHQKFGYGTVEDKEDDKLIVNFDFSGSKKVLSSFIRSSTQHRR